MSLLPTFTTLLWNCPPYLQLFGSFTIIKDLTPHQGLWLESRIHGGLLQLLPLSIPFTYPPLGHHVVSLLLWWLLKL